MVLGAFWYSPIAFGNAWMKCLNKTQDQLGSQTIPMIGSIIASLFMAVALSIIISLADIHTLVEGILLGLVIGLGVIFPSLLSDNLFCGWGTRLLLIQSGYRMLTAVAMSIILTVWPA